MSDDDVFALDDDSENEVPDVAIAVNLLPHSSEVTTASASKDNCHD